MNTALLCACLNGIHRLHSFRYACPITFMIFPVNTLCSRLAMLSSPKTSNWRTTANLPIGSWDSYVPLPDRLLETLHRRFPDATLSISLRSLDQTVIHSPQLDRLCISLPCLDANPGERAKLWEQLKQILVQGRNLRALTLDVYPDLALRQSERTISKNDQDCFSDASVLIRNDAPSVSFPGAAIHALLPSSLPADKVELPLEPGDKLPSLQHLDIRANNYNLDVNHCTQLLNSMDWRKLKRLRLGPSDPIIFFEIFKGKLPQLEILEITYSHENQYYSPFTAYKPRLSVCADFVASISALETLVIRCDTFHLHDRLWMALARAHGAHLRTLSIQARYPGLEAPDYKGNIRDLLASFPSLITLDLALRTCAPNGYGCSHCPTRRHGLVSALSVSPVHG